MKYSIKWIVIGSAVSAVIVAFILKAVGESIGIPPSWNPAVVGGISGVIGSILGKKFAIEKQ